MKILSDKEPIDIFCEASNVLNKAVIHTLGPKGTNTAVQTKEGYYEIINDGKSILEPITSLEPDLAPALETLKQPQYQTLSMEKQVVILYALVNGYLANIENKKVKEFNDALLQFMEDKRPEILQEIKLKRELKPELADKLKAAIEDYLAFFNL